MLKRRLISVLFVVVAAVAVFPQEAGILSFGLEPSINIPLGTSATLYTMGAGAELKATYILPFLPFTHVLAGINYNLAPTAFQTSLNTLGLGIGGGVNYTFFQNLHLVASVEGGMFTASYDTKYALGGYLQASAGAVYSLIPSLSIGADVGYKHYFASPNPLFSGLSVSLNAVLHLGREHQPLLKMQTVQVDPVFPILRKYYDTKPMGKVTIKNDEQGSISNVKVTFFVKQYMDGPKQSAVIPEMKAGEVKTIDLNALFTDSILNITEPTIVQADINVDYTLGKSPESIKQSQSLRILDRNALTWDDTRKTAAFVTAKDPAVLTFSKHFAGLVRDKWSPALDNNFLIAAGLHEALAVYGIQYVPDPTQTWDARFSNKTAVDFLQFPTQTLTYRAGDCDDLSILYNALLESVGVETAFITAPGHIFTAFAINATPDDLATKFTKPDDFIVMNGKVWIPVEITAVSDSFLRAWELGATEWRKYLPTKQVAFTSTHDSWDVYESVGFQSSDQVKLPDEAKVLARFATTKQTFVDSEIKQRVADLKSRITNNAASATYRSRLGTLYAKYGMYPEAEQQYNAAIALKYLPAIINMGNVQFLKGDYKKALSYYQTALAQKAQDPLILINAAVADQFLGNTDEAKKYYAQAKQISPTMAADYAYIETGANPGLRGGDVTTQALAWDEE